MRDYLWAFLDGLPPGAYVMYLALIGITVCLVRSSMRPTFFALIAWPGTLAHELSHAAVGFVLGAKPSSLSMWPKALEGGQWQLGAVEFTNLRWWNAPWTALAPMLLAPLSFTIAWLWGYPALASGELGYFAMVIYLCAVMLQASWPSSTDFAAAVPGLAIIGLVLAWLW